MTLALLLACSTPAPDAPATVPAPAPALAPEEEEESTAQVPPTNQPPKVLKVEIKPDKPSPTSALEAVVDARDPNKDPITLKFRWYIDQDPVMGESAARLPAGNLAKGNRVKVVVTASDGEKTDDAESAEVVVSNTPPRMLTGPRDVTRLDGFRFRAEDVDNDELTWSLSGAPDGMTLSADGVLSYRGSEDEPGGAYTLAVEASDGEAFARFELPIKVNPGSRAAKAP